MIGYLLLHVIIGCLCVWGAFMIGMMVPSWRSKFQDLVNRFNRYLEDKIDDMDKK